MVKCFHQFVLINIKLHENKMKILLKCINLSVQFTDI